MSGLLSKVIACTCTCVVIYLFELLYIFFLINILASTSLRILGLCHQCLFQCFMHCPKGLFHILHEQLQNSLTAPALAELAHLSSAINLYPGENRFSSYETIATYGFQELLAFALYLPFILRGCVKINTSKRYWSYWSSL